MLVNALSGDDWRTIGAVVGAIAGVSAFAWNVWRAWHDRRSRVRVFTQINEDTKEYSVLVTVTNVGQTVEAVREIGLEVASNPGVPVDDRRVQRGTLDATERALTDIAQAIRDGNDERSARSMLTGMFAHRPTHRAWRMPPGGLAEAEFDLVTYRVDEPQLGSSGYDDMPDGPMLPPLRPYAVLASGKTVRGRPIRPDHQRIDSVRYERNKPTGSPWGRVARVPLRQPVDET